MCPSVPASGAVDENHERSMGRLASSVPQPLTESLFCLNRQPIRALSITTIRFGPPVIGARPQRPPRTSRALCRYHGNRQLLDPHCPSGFPLPLCYQSVLVVAVVPTLPKKASMRLRLLLLNISSYNLLRPLSTSSI